MLNPIRLPALVLALATTVIVTAAAAQAEIVLDTAFPTVRKEARILVADDGLPVAGAELTATYRPGSAVERTTVVGKTAEDGSIDWVPAEAGIVSISAAWTGEDGSERTASINASVKFDPTPVSGIIIMIIAGVVLIGGGIERITALLRSPESV